MTLEMLYKRVDGNELRLNTHDVQIAELRLEMHLIGVGVLATFSAVICVLIVLLYH